MFIGQFTGRLSLEGIAARGEGRGGGLARTLGPFSLIGLGIGCIIGAGIFVLTGKAAAQLRGPGDRPVVCLWPASPAPSSASATPNSPR